ncbi:hypothetical protein [Saliphagus sp. LR7]|uniref:hypothetical protein n=1 Tax=Saliphagus sp. LR7 TaxID=2282654 RepID=UPI000DF7A764|nr:hypothetical protein [Saliphagus sp. LR7]
MASELRRRDVLRVSGALALVGAAGCLDNVMGGASEGNGSDGDDSTPVDENDTETAEGTDDPDDGEGTNRTDGAGGSNDSEGSDDGGANETGDTDEITDSNATDESVDPNGTGGDGGENDSGQRDDEDAETGGSNETESSDGEGEVADAEGTETEADDSAEENANDSAEDGDGGEERGEGNGEGDDGGDGGTGGESQSTEPPEGFVTYTNDELGYSIAHPEGWEVEESGEEVYVGDPESRRELGVLTLDAAAFDSSEALSAEFLSNLEADYEGVEVREEGDRSLASGQDARLVDVAYGDPEGERGRRRSRLLFVTDPETDAGYVAEVAAPAEAFDDALAERAETMLASFRIESGESTERIGGPRLTRPLARAGTGIGRNPRENGAVGRVPIAGIARTDRRNGVRSSAADGRSVSSARE